MATLSSSFTETAASDPNTGTLILKAADPTRSHFISTLTASYDGPTPSGDVYVEVNAIEVFRATLDSVDKISAVAIAGGINESVQVFIDAGGVDVVGNIKIVGSSNG